MNMNMGASERRLLDPKRITHLRETVGATKASLARECGFTLSHICKVEKGRNRLSYSALTAIADALERLGAIPQGKGLDAISTLDPRHATPVSIVCPDIAEAIAWRDAAFAEVPLERVPRAWAERIRVDANNCWIWMGSCKETGYGTISSAHSSSPAHRVVYIATVGPLPDGLHLDHLCKVRACVNPAHLEPVPPRVNVLRSESFAAVNAAKTECKWGHPFDAANTAIVIDKKGRPTRRCRCCSNEINKRSREKRRKAAV